MKIYTIKDIFFKKNILLNQLIIVKGWIKSFRNNCFILINDGSIHSNLQIFISRDIINTIKKKINIGAAISAEGILIESLGKNQIIELKCKKIEINAESCSKKIQKTILQPKYHNLEKLRKQGHLRFRTNLFSSIMRIRHTLSFAIHRYFNKKGFYQINTPIITSFDSEGGGENFKINTIKDDDFFDKPAYMTVSGQLEGEIAALSLSKIYTFGPVFRAENSNTHRHLAEFWMVEPEMAFYDINDNISLAENFLKNIILYTIKNCKDDLSFINDYNIKNNKKNKISLYEKINLALNNDFIKISYTEVIKILKNSDYSKNNKFTYPVYWGIDLKSEHEQFLINNYFNYIPIIIFDYPKRIKPFYMRLNKDNKTVSAMDIIFPNIGEIIGGSQREERYDVLLEKMKKFNINIKNIWWYLDIRNFGCSPHSGFGLGFERLIQFITGMNNIRDVIPFPRTKSFLEF